MFASELKVGEIRPCSRKGPQDLSLAVPSNCPRQDSIGAHVLPGWLMLWTKQGWCSGAEDKPKPFVVHSLFTAPAQSNPSNRKKSSVVTVTSRRKAMLTQLEDIPKYWLLPSTNSISLTTMWHTVSLFAPSRLFLISKQHNCCCSKCTIQIDNII